MQKAISPILFYVLSIAMLCLIVLPSCAFVRGEVGQEFQDEDVQMIQKDHTNRAEVAELLGAPNEVVYAAGREIFHYRRFDGKLGYLIFISRLNIGSDNLYVFFDKGGIVEEVIFGKRTDQVSFQVWPFGD